jgi:hypothetical protein
MRRYYLTVGMLLAVLIAVGLIMWNSAQVGKAPIIDVVQPIPEEIPKPIEEAMLEEVNFEEPIQPLKPLLVLPPLLDSDDFVREELRPELAQPALDWLQQPDLVRRGAVVLENAARGEYPRGQLAFIRVTGSYKVVTRGDRYFVDPSTYQRYDEIVDVLVSVPAQSVVRLISMLDSLLIEALRELGVDAESVEVLIEYALANVLRTPLLTGEIELVRPNVIYVYADPRLESLNPLKKQLLRTGPKNLAKLQSYARGLMLALGKT